MPVDLLLTHIRQLWTVQGPGPLVGPDQGAHEPIEDGVVAIEHGRVTFAGPGIEIDTQVIRGPETRIVDLGLRHSVVPGFVDPHTHVVYAGNRLPELRRRLAGATYAEIAAVMEVAPGSIGTLLIRAERAFLEAFQTGRHCERF